MKLGIFILVIFFSRQNLICQDWKGYGQGIDYIEIKQDKVFCEFEGMLQYYHIDQQTAETITLFKLDYTTGEIIRSSSHYLKKFGDIDSLYLIAANEGNVIKKFYNPNLNPYTKFKFNFEEIEFEHTGYDRNRIRTVRLTKYGDVRIYDNKSHTIQSFEISKTEIDSIANIIEKIDISSINWHHNYDAISHASTKTFTFIDYHRNRFTYTSQQVPTVLKPLKDFLIELENNN